MTAQLDQLRTLVLNADLAPFDVVDWKSAIKASVRGSAFAVAEHATLMHSPSTTMAVQSVLVRRRYVQTDRIAPLTRQNMFLAYAEFDGEIQRWRCALCGKRATKAELTFDHVIPRAKGGRTVWGNLCLSHAFCNSRKGHRLLAEAGMQLHIPLRAPTERQIRAAAVREGMRDAPKDWQDFLSEAYWNTTLDA
jgi:5-methylcytosine-specific restriction endonuclease McrA